jgi:hypothetical protein
VGHTAAALIGLAQNEASYDFAFGVVLLKRQFHPGIVRSAAAKALVRRVWR